MKNLNLYFLTGILMIGVAVIMLLTHRAPSQRTNTTAEKAVASCDTSTETYVMTEDVMASIKLQQKVQVEMGYYNCKEVERDDLVLVQTSARPEPVIRYVKVIPKDEFKLEPRKQNFALTVNGKEIENGQQETYLFSEQKSRLLKLYQQSLKGKMDADTYFVFSDRADGGFDSTRFGPVEKNRILGRVVVPGNTSTK